MNVGYKKKVKEPFAKRIYLRILLWSLNNRIVVVLMAFLLLAAALVSFKFYGKGVEFFPDTEPKRAYVHIKAPEGINLDTSDKLVAKVENMICFFVFISVFFFPPL